MKRLGELRPGVATIDNNSTTTPKPKETQVTTTNAIKNKQSVVVITPPKNSKVEIEKTHPDGEWGWVVVAAAFVTQWMVVGLQNSSGVIFNELVKKYDASRGDTGFVSSISCGMMFILGPFTTSLCQRFGCRIIAIIGGFLCVFGMVLSAHAPSLQIMYVTFGLTWGLGTSFCYFPTLIILVPYFNEKLALVNGIVSAGAGVGTLILSPSIQWFAHNYGVKYMFYGLAVLHILVVVAGTLYRPLSDKYKKRQGIEIRIKNDDLFDKVPERQLTKETLLSKDSRVSLDRRGLPIDEHAQELHEEYGSADGDEMMMDYYVDSSEDIKQVLVDLFTDKAFVAWCFGLAIFMLGYFVPFVHIVRYAKLIGIKEVDAAFLISVLSIVATIFKILSGKLAGTKNIDTMKLYQLSLLVMGVATTLIPVQKSYFGLVMYAIVFGMSESCFIVMIPLITKDIVGVQRLPLALGCVFMLMGIPTVVGAPIAGWIFDAFQDYSYAFYVAGMMNIAGVLVMFFITYYKDEGNLRMKVEEERRQYREDKEKQEAASRTIVMTSFASTERIYLSSRDLLNPYDDVIRKRPVSRIVEFTSFASSERIFLSNRDLVDPFPQNNNSRCNILDRKLSSQSHLNPDSGYSTLQHPRTRSAGHRYPRPESASIMDSYQIDGTGFSPYTNRPLSLQFNTTHENQAFPMPKKLEHIHRHRSTTIAEENENTATTPVDDKTDRKISTIPKNPASPVLIRLKKQSHAGTTTNGTNGNVFFKFWERLLKNNIPRTVSVTSQSQSCEVIPTEEVFIIDERLTVV